MRTTALSLFKSLLGMAAILTVTGCDVFESSGPPPSRDYYRPSTFNPNPQTVPGYIALPPSQLNSYSRGFN